MNFEFHILGHCHATLALVIDTLLAIHPDDAVTITIVSNIPVNDPAQYDFRDSMNLKILEVDSKDWDGRARNPILGVVHPRTKKIVYSHFLEVHGIHEEDYYTVVHPATVIARQTTIGAGAYIGPGVVVGPYTTIGTLTTINRNASIGHHTTIGRLCKINPGSNVAGRCHIGEHVTIGMGANVFDGVSIGDNAVIGGGAVVSKPIPPDVVAAGIPARVVRSHVNSREDDKC